MRYKSNRPQHFRCIFFRIVPQSLTLLETAISEMETGKTVSDGLPSTQHQSSVGSVIGLQWLVSELVGNKGGEKNSNRQESPSTSNATLSQYHIQQAQTIGFTRTTRICEIALPLLTATAKNSLSGSVRVVNVSSIGHHAPPSPGGYNGRLLLVVPEITISQWGRNLARRRYTAKASQ